MIILIELALLIAVCYSLLLIYRKAGYSGWQAVLIFLPLINVGWIVAFASGTWPIERELAIARLGLGKAKPQDEELALSAAIRYEAHGMFAQAQDIYQLLIQEGAQPEIVRYATTSLNEKMRQTPGQTLINN